MKKVIFAVVGIILVAALGRLGWAYLDVKKDETKAHAVSALPTEAVASSTENFAVHYDDTNSTSTKGAKVMLDISSSGFTDAQLVRFKADLAPLYLRYKDKDTNAEPLKTQFWKELDAIFLKDLEVSTNLSSGSWSDAGMLLQPQIAKIFVEVETQYGKPKKAPFVVSPTSKISISNLNYTTILFPELSKYTAKPLTFNITSPEIAKDLCINTYYYHVDTSRDDFSNLYTLCNPYYSKVKGVYSDSVYFSNLASASSGGYDGTSRSSFEIEGIDHEVQEFYVKDTSGKESNRLKLTLTSPAKNTNTLVSTGLSGASTANTPTATITANGVTNLSANGGDKITYVYSSSNADSFSGTNSVSGCAEAANEVNKSGSSTASGSYSDSIPFRFSGCTITMTYTAKNTKTGQQATAVAIVRVN